MHFKIFSLFLLKQKRRSGQTERQIKKTAPPTEMSNSFTSLKEMKKTGCKKPKNKNSVFAILTTELQTEVDNQTEVKLYFEMAA